MDTVGAKNIYALFSGNGGYGSFVIVKLDGTMYTLSSYDLSETGIIEIKDTQVNNVDYVIAVQGFDAFYFDIVDKNGNVLGKHKGLYYYTIGQRRGLGIAHKTPLFVGLLQI